MPTLQIQCTDTRSANAVVEVFQRGSNGQPDTLVRRGRIGSAAVTVSLPAGAYVQVRELSEDEAKTIDNW